MGDFPLCNSCYSLLCLFLILMCFLKKWWQDFVSDLSPEETVRRMQKGRVGGSTDLLIVAIALESHFNNLNVWLILLSQQAYSLEKFRSLQDKLLLLEEAVALYDGNVITAVSITWPMTSSFHIENLKNSVVSSINHILLHLQFPVSGLDLFKKVFK